MFLNFLFLFPFSPFKALCSMALKNRKHTFVFLSCFSPAYYLCDPVTDFINILFLLFPTLCNGRDNTSIYPAACSHVPISPRNQVEKNANFNFHTFWCLLFSYTKHLWHPFPFSLSKTEKLCFFWASQDSKQYFYWEGWCSFFLVDFY